MSNEMDKFNTSKAANLNRYADSSEVPQNTVDQAFEPGVQVPEGGFVFIKSPSGDDLLHIYEMLLTEIGSNVASFDVVQSVYRYNPISFWGIYRSNDEQRRFPKLIGFFAYLPLNKAGHAAFLANKLSGTTPDLSLLARADEEPTALYIWAMVTPGFSNLAFMLNAYAIGLERYQRIPLVAWIATDATLKALKRTSKRVSDVENLQVGSTFTMRLPEKFMSEARALPIVEGKRPAARAKPARPQLETMLVSTPDQMSMVMAIRAAVFMVEQNCPYSEEFDGNDYAGAHMLGFVNGEPAAVLRIRYFADFVKIERLAVLPRFRRTLIAKAIIEHGIEICRRKGYRKMYGHAQTRLVPLWARFGFQPMVKNTKLVFSDHEYVEIAGDIPPHPDPLTPDSDPLMLIRPEGKWDQPGVLDLSSQRPPTNPH
jgi:predicted GNAT family N-acyltransferase